MSAPGPVPAGTLIPPRHERTLAEKVVASLVAALALTAVGAVAWVLRFLALPVILAFLLAYVLGPLVDILESRGLPRWVAVLLCFGVMNAALAVVVMGVWPGLEQWMKEAPRPGEKSAFELQLEHRLDGWEAALSRVYLQLDWHTAFARLRDVLQEQRRTLVEGLPALAMALVSNLGSVLLGPVIGLFILLDGMSMKHALVRLVPNRYFETVLVMLDRVDRQIAAYLRGAASESALVTVLLSLVLLLAGMPQPVLFGALYGVANVIPMAGPVIGASAGLLFSLLDPAAPSAGLLLGCYGAVYVVDAAIINPLVVGKNLDMHPLTVIVGISIGGSLGGILGMLAIIPLIAITKAIAATVADAVRNAAAL